MTSCSRGKKWPATEIRRPWFTHHRMMNVTGREPLGRPRRASADCETEDLPQPLGFAVSSDLQLSENLFRSRLLLMQSFISSPWARPQAFFTSFLQSCESFGCPPEDFEVEEVEAGGAAEDCAAV